MTAHLELRRTCLQLEDEGRKRDGVLRMANKAGEVLYTDNRNDIFINKTSAWCAWPRPTYSTWTRWATT